jgi:hypothetical protein
MRGKFMNQDSNLTITVDDEMRTEYDFSGGVRGKYYEAYQQATNVVVLEPDMAEIFRDSAAVNEALRSLVKLAKSVVDKSNSEDKLNKI